MPIPSRDMLLRSQPSENAVQVSVSTTIAYSGALSAGVYDIYNGSGVLVRLKLGNGGAFTLTSTQGYPLPIGATLEKVYIDETEFDQIAFITVAGSGTVDVTEVK